VAEIFGGIELTSLITPMENQLVNVVEEMALPYEAGLSVITAGKNPDDTVIAITQGALEKLDRRELQAIIAHEFGHIPNGDAALNIRVATWTCGLIFFAPWVSNWRIYANHGCYIFSTVIIAGTFCLSLVADTAGSVLAGFLGSVLGRRREFLANAFAAQFTRGSQGLGGQRSEKNNRLKNPMAHQQWPIPGFRVFFHSCPFS